MFVACFLKNEMHITLNHLSFRARDYDERTFAKDSLPSLFLNIFIYTEAFMRKILIGTAALATVTLAPSVQAEYQWGSVMSA